MRDLRVKLVMPYICCGKKVNTEEETHAIFYGYIHPKDKGPTGNGYDKPACVCQDCINAGVLSGRG